MKLSNNAIKFLMAQYRAIYKNAYVKGLATAVILTSALAAGQAQAAAGKLAFDGENSTQPEVTITGKNVSETTDTDRADYTSIGIVKKITNKFAGNIKIESGSAATNGTDGNFVKGVAGSSSFTGANLTISGAAAANSGIGISILGNADGAATAEFDNVTVKYGTLLVQGSGANAGTFKAKTISLGGEGVDTANKSILSISDKGTVGTDLTGLTKLSEGTQITLGANSKVAANKAGAKGTSTLVMNASKLTINGGNIETDGDNSQKAALSINLVKGSMDGGTVKILEGDSLTFNFSGDSALVDDTVEGSPIAAREFVINKGTFDLGADVTVKGAGTLKFGSTLTNITHKSGGSIKVSGGASVYAANDKNAAAIAGTLALTVAEGGTLELGEGSVDLTSDTVSFLAPTADKAKSKIGFATGAGLRTAGDLTIGGDYNNEKHSFEAKSVTVAGDSDATFNKTAIKADNALTLGVASTFGSGDATITLGEQSFNKIKASADYISAGNDNVQKKALLLKNTEGTISGKKLTLQSGSTLNVANGTWTVQNEIAVHKATSAGKLNVGTAENGVAVMKFAAGSKLTATSGSISIGKDSASPLYAELDLSNLSKDDVTFSKAEITVTKNGSLVLSEGAAQSLVSNLIATDGTKLQIQSGAMTTVNGNITLKPGQLVSGSATVQAIGLSGDGSTLKADSITIAEEVAAQTATALNVGAGTLETGTLTLTSFNTGTNKQNNFSLDSGNFIVLNNLSSDDGAKLDLTFTKAETKVQLGKVIPVQTGSSIYKLDPEASASGNTVGYNIIMAEGSTLDVKSGEWRGQDLTINSGSATIGSGMTGEDGNKITATFNGNKLTIGASATTGTGLIINEGGEANFSEFYQSADSSDPTNSVTATIKGKMTVKGKYVAYEPEVTADNNGGTAKAEVPESFGLSIAGNINIDGSNAVLSIGKDALSTAIVGFSGAGKDTVIQYKEPGKPSGAAVDLVTGHVTFANFGTLELDLSHLNNNSFTVDQLAAVRKEFTGNGSTPISGGFIHLVGGALTDSGLSGDQISVENLSKFNDFKDIKVDNLMNAQVTGVTNSNVISQNVGSLMAKDDTETAAQIGQATLNNARPITSGSEAHFAVNTAGKDMNLNVKGGGYLHLNNGGIAGKINLRDTTSGKTQLLVSGGQTQTVIEQVSGDSSTRMELVSGKTTVNKELVVGALDTAVGADLVVNGSKSVNGLTLNSANSVSTLKGNVEAGKVSFAGETVFAGNNNSFLLMNASGKDSGLTFKNGTTTVSSMLGIDVSKAVDNGVEVLDNAVLNVDGAIKLGSGSYLGVGSEHEYAADGKTVVESGSTGYLYAKMVDLNGGIMAVDPEYGMKTSVAAVGAFGAGTFNLLNANDAGTVSGDVVVSQNAALGVGQSVNLDTVKNFVAQYQDADGSLSKDGVANVLYIDGKIMHKSGRIILDGQNRLDDSVAVLREGSTAFAYGYDADSNNSVSGAELADLYIGNGSILALGNGAVNGAIEFTGAKAAIYAPRSADSKKAQQGKIVLAGEDFLKSRNINLFTAGAKPATNPAKPETAVPGSAANVTVLGETGKDDIRVESLNGLMYFTLEAGKALEEKGYNLKLDTKRVDTAFTAASEPMRDFLIGYTAQDKNWYEVANAVDGAKTEVLLGATASPMISAEGGNIAYSADATEEFKQANPLSNFVAVNTGTAEAPQYVAYEKAYNGFLEDVVRNTNGADADRVGRMAAFG
ncbi:hypothetical protein, partial [Anaerobiospirillum sp. NML120449]|uniref:beta strand repeat-containing protein n=1 Tax=Anaerobiospirillum sp. NML120449 TaxID=2932817 RepID=UPI001FF48476